MATDIAPRDPLAPFPGQRFPWQERPATAANARVVGWQDCGRWKVAHLVMIGDDERPYILCRGHGSFCYCKAAPEAMERCWICEEMETEMSGAA